MVGVCRQPSAGMPRIGVFQARGRVTGHRLALQAGFAGSTPDGSTGGTMDDKKRVEIPLFEVYDNPCVSLVTGEFTNILPDGSPGVSGDDYKEVLEQLATCIKRDRERGSASGDSASVTR